MNSVRAWLFDYGRSFHPAGLAVALVFFTWTMSPSLLPRAWYLQGVATGIGVATGYTIGCLIAGVLRRCGIAPSWSLRTRRLGWWGLAGAAVIVVPTFLILGSWWQQIIRDLVGVPRAERSFYVLVLLIALVVALVLVAAGRGLRAGTDRLARYTGRVVPVPVARLSAVVLAVVLAVLVVNGAVYRGLISVAERSAESADRSTADGVVAPSLPERSGSPTSNEGWESLGREGRTFVAGGPTSAEIESVTGMPARTPIRVYAGRESADTVEGVAERVVAELERTSAFDRKTLAVVTTTGRGWVNGNVAGAFEYINGGDSAIAAMQYSFLPSALSFIADRDTPQQAGQALFEAVHRAWSARPQEQRPKLVVFGESLGSYGGQAAFASGSDIVARTDGALLVGTPNFAQPWGRITENRDPGSFERLPVVDEGRNIRFASRPDDVDLPEPWEFPRVVFWQHASDPITWWSFDLLLHEPDWLREPLGPDVDPGMRWIPFVTFWQVTLDMIFSADVPDGFGHSFGPEAADLWVDILAPEVWGEGTTVRVRNALAGIAAED
ncbi:alpha/beta hydrolase [Rhodococcus pyridinivorans]|uniref:alpha/beta hydrolase n=1 Tax=Rhodococcus pyridinivorans TaxID=103816 RepID=UPI001902F8BF|nr:alpha/beta-hydrolase family protein [Rhodococcus pyridinivorans]MCW3470428.1 alpha/beta hydrolase [Rhodococcus pyridinivorans]QQM53009.1 alpha/beta hydrolase [Rhodococcus pyridinivorans]